MPEIEIRPAISSDIPTLMKIDHSCQTTHVWQMDTNHDPDQIQVAFREIRLPRVVRLEYPRVISSMPDTWIEKNLFLVAAMGEELVGYLTLNEDLDTKTAHIIDLVVNEPLRRQGVGSALLLAAKDWCRQRRLKRMVVAIQAKNHAGINLARKLGFDFCGFNDQYFVNHDIAIFFTLFLK